MVSSKVMHGLHRETLAYIVGDCYVQFVDAVILSVYVCVCAPLVPSICMSRASDMFFSLGSLWFLTTEFYCSCFKLRSPARMVGVIVQNIFWKSSLISVFVEEKYPEQMSIGPLLAGYLQSHFDQVQVFHLCVFYCLFYEGDRSFSSSSVSARSIHRALLYGKILTYVKSLYVSIYYFQTIFPLHLLLNIIVIISV